jgi:hypothetical protein
VEKVEATVSLSALAEDRNQRDELGDLLQTHFATYLKDKFYTLLGRGCTQYSDFPDELWQISVTSNISLQGASQIPRPGDTAGFIHEGRVTVGVTLFMYIDGDVLREDGRPWWTSFDGSPRVDE